MVSAKVRWNMKCPYCKQDNNRVVAVHGYDSEMPKRHRKCINCGRKFNTEEYYGEKTIRDVELEVRNENSVR